MWLSENVNLDDRLFEAHREGNLVIFVGAGVSQGNPSGLPSFRGLTEEVCRRFGTTLSKQGWDGNDEQDAPYDLILENLRSQGNVKRCVQQIIENTESRHTELHRHLIMLASSAPQLKIVTTNYDLHLESAALESEKEFSIYNAPALPLGRRFEGLIHLHGSVKEDLDSLVVLRSDFGRAYLTDGWATRFLHDMFRNYAVLFVGYSHRDLILDYLARGLSDQGDRFVITSDGDLTRWQQLGITPVLYQLEGENGHSQLTEAIKNWATISSSGASELSTRIRNVMANSPTIGKADESLIQRALVDSTLTRAVCDTGDLSIWLPWMMAQESFKQMFIPGFRESDSDYLVNWFTEFCMTGDRESSKAFAAIISSGGRISYKLWSRLAFRLSQVQGESGCPIAKMWVERWASWLLSTAPEDGGLNVGVLLNNRDFSTYTVSTLSLWAYVTKPRASIRPVFSGSDGDPSTDVFVDIDFTDSTYAVTEFWERSKAAMAGEVTWQVLAIAEANLSEANRLYRGLTGPPEPEWDPVTFRRIAIETSEGDFTSHDDLAQIIIDSARDAWGIAHQQDSARAMNIVNRWLISKAPMLRRLGWYSLNQLVTQDSSDLLGRILEHNALSDWPVRDEILTILRVRINQVDAPTLDALLRQVRSFEEETQENGYRKFTVLSWLVKSAPNWSDAAVELKALTTRYPQFAEYGESDLPRRGFSEVSTPLPIISAEEFKRRIRENASELLEDFLKYVDLEFPFYHPSWSDVLVTVVSGVRDDFESGLILWRSTESSPLVEKLYDLRSSIIQAWIQSPIPLSKIPEIFDLISSSESVARLPHLISNLLVEISRVWEENLECAGDENALAVAEVLRTSHLNDSVHAFEPQKALDFAINDVCGRLVEFYLRRLFVRNKLGSRVGVSSADSEGSKIGTMLGEDNPHRLAVLSTLCSQINFLTSVDEVWTESHLLPSMRWEKGVSSGIAAWSGYLVGGRWNEWLLGHDLIDAYIESIERSACLDDNQIRILCAHIAGISVYSVNHQGNQEWFRRLLQKMSAKESLLVALADAMRFILHNEKPEGVQRLWDGWLKEYLSNRVLDIPVTLGELEASAIADWCPFLGSAFPDVVNIVSRSKAKIGDDMLLCYQMHETGMAKTYPAECARLLISLLRNTSNSSLRDWSLRDCISDVKGLLEEQVLTDLVNAAQNAGYDVSD